jgi:hypothetical protein
MVCRRIIYSLTRLARQKLLQRAVQDSQARPLEARVPACVQQAWPPLRSTSCTNTRQSLFKPCCPLSPSLLSQQQRRCLSLRLPRVRRRCAPSIRRCVCCLYVPISTVCESNRYRYRTGSARSNNTAIFRLIDALSCVSTTRQQPDDITNYSMTANNKATNNSQPGLPALQTTPACPSGFARLSRQH